jgi:hypothetical protein
MVQPKLQNRGSASSGLDALRVTAAAFGVYAGLLGIEHGFFETLKGNVGTKSTRIMAAGFELPFPFGHEPALTLIPNYLATGIAAMIVGLAIIVWSAGYVHRKHGAWVLLLLSVTLLLVGGGFGPISLLIVACFTASGIGGPLNFWRRYLPGPLMRWLAALWPWSITAALLWVPGEYAAGQILGLKNDHRQILTNLNLMLSYPMLALFVLTLFAGFAREAWRRRE